MTDKERFEEAWRTFRPKILSYLKNHIHIHEDAEDLCSDIFCKAWEHLQKGTESSLSSYLYVITRNSLTDYYRTRKETVPIEDYDPLQPDFLEEIIKNNLLERLACALGNLPLAEKDIIVLHYYSNLSLAEISRKMGIPYSVVKRSHRAALQRLEHNL